MLFFSLFIFLVHSFECDANRTTYIPAPSTYTLKYVQTLARHGDRTPSNSYTGDRAIYECNAHEESHIYIESGKRPSHAASFKNTVIDKNTIYADDYFWAGSCESGQLTPKGISQLYKLGLEFDGIYRQTLKFIPTYFDTNKIKFRTTGKIRTFHSAQAFAQTFYPIERRKEVVDIEFVSTPYDIETMKPNSACCPYSQELEDQIVKEEKIEEMRQEEPFKSTFEKLKRITGYKSSLNFLYNYVDLMMPLICHNQSLPCKNDECMTYDEYLILLEQNNKENQFFFRKDLARFQVGFFVNEMIMDYNDALKNGTLFQYYSGHDTTILPLLSLLEQNLNIRVPYASTLVFEYFEKDGVMYVRVLFNGLVLDLSKVCKMNEEKMCTVEEYQKYMKDLIPTIEECEQTKLKKNGKNMKKPISREGWGSYN